jgi:hypothetical protein
LARSNQKNHWIHLDDLVLYLAKLASHRQLFHKCLVGYIPHTTLRAFGKSKSLKHAGAEKTSVKSFFWPAQELSAANASILQLHQMRFLK